MGSKPSKVLFSLIIFLIGTFSILLIYQSELYDSLSREDHLIEYLSSFFLLLASFFILKSFIFAVKRDRTLNKWRSIFLFIVSIVFFIAAGEEISWAQRIFNIETPEYLAAINDQNELNFHNINKKFFDRAVDRLTMIFVVISSMLLFSKRNFVLGISKPDIFIICAFAITPFYKQNNVLDFHHIIYIPLVVLLVYFFVKRRGTPLMAVFITLFVTFWIAYIHSEFNEFFPSHNNSANEYREFLFCLCCMTYSFLIMKNMVRNDV